MAVDKQEFAVGTVFTGRYKKATYRLEVVEVEAGKRYRLEDGQEFKSLSAAGSKIMGGKPVNGWRFWSLEGEAPAQQPEAPAESAEPADRPNGKERKHPVLRRMHIQEGAPAGKVRWWCEACCNEFLAPASITPVGCPQGHPADGADLMAGERVEPAENSGAAEEAAEEEAAS